MHSFWASHVGCPRIIRCATTSRLFSRSRPAAENLWTALVRVCLFARGGVADICSLSSAKFLCSWRGVCAVFLGTVRNDFEHFHETFSLTWDFNTNKVQNRSTFSARSTLCIRNQPLGRRVQAPHKYARRNR